MYQNKSQHSKLTLEKKLLPLLLLVLRPQPFSHKVSPLLSYLHSPCSMSSNIIHGPMETHTHTCKNADKELRELNVDVFYFVLIMIMGT